MDWAKTLWKSFVGFLVGLAAVVLMGVAQAISNYKPIICTELITTDCTPQFVSTVFYSIVPIVVGGIYGVVNWLKNRQKMS